MRKVKLYLVEDRGYGYVVIVYEVPEDQTSTWLQRGFCASEKEARYRKVAQLNEQYIKELDTVWNCQKQKRLEY